MGSTMQGSSGEHYNQDNSQMHVSEKSTQMGLGGHMESWKSLSPPKAHP